MAIKTYKVKERPAMLDILIYRGDTYEHEIFIVSDDDQPVDITSYSFRLEALRGDGSVAFTWSTANGLIAQTSTNAIRILIDNASTETYVPAVYAYDLEMTTDQGTVKTVLEGRIKVLKDKTV